MWQPLLGWRELREFSAAFPRLCSETKKAKGVSSQSTQTREGMQRCLGFVRFANATWVSTQWTLLSQHNGSTQRWPPLK